MHLLIVESPSKAKTISRYLGAGVEVMASGGHIKDLPEREMGVDIENGFEPKYVLIPDERKRGNRERVEMLRRLARKAAEIYLATDPDREGEMIAQHLKEEIVNPGLKGKIYRLTFHEITKTAVENALQSRGQIDEYLVAAQKARRIIDRLLGYSLSPWLSEEIGKPRLSAGRVQSVVLRFVVDRFREIQNFQPVPYWTVEGKFITPRGDEFTARLYSIRGWIIKTSDFETIREGELHLKEENDVQKVVQRLEKVKEWQIGKKDVREKLASPPPPLTTSTMQQMAAKKLGLSVQETMALAQKLYEGVDLPEGRVGLITYLRTDSTRLAAAAVEEIRAFIEQTYGKAYLPNQPPVHRGQKAAQEAHEAIRPTSIARHPESLAAHLPDEMLGLYTLIWQRAVASQMSPARLQVTSIEVHGEQRFIFRTAGTVVLFPGFRQVEEDLSKLLARLRSSRQEPETGRNEETTGGENVTEGEGGKSDDEKTGKGGGETDGGGKILPEILLNETVQAEKFWPRRHQTSPPRPYNEATLVKKMESTGIGRPSTYAQVIQTLEVRKYMVRRRGIFEPTPLGCQVVDVLTSTFPDVFCPEYTARMEIELDEIAEGRRNWQLLVGDFYRHLLEQMRKVPSIQRNWEEKKEDETVGSKSYHTGQKQVASRTVTVSGKEQPSGKRKGYGAKGNGQRKTWGEMNPEMTHRNAVSDIGGEKRQQTPVPDEVSNVSGMPPICPECGGGMQRRKGPFGVFWGCQAYPKCRGIRKINNSGNG